MPGPSRAPRDLPTALAVELVVKRREARREYKCHFGAANTCRAKHRWYGALATLTSLGAGSAFLAKAALVLPILDLLPFGLSLFAAGFMALVTFNRYAETAERHYSTARQWEEYRDLCSALLMKVTSVNSGAAAADSLLAEYIALTERRSAIRRDALGYPDWLYRKHEHIKDKVEIESLSENVES
jgi:hypothetical protein